MEFKDTDIILLSYPRSGSTWLRFMLCNYYFPTRDHDFESVNSLIPTLDSDEMGDPDTEKLRVFKSHEIKDFGPAKVIYLVRNVGDVLISEYYFQKKFYKNSLSLEEWIVQNDYGKTWNKHVCDALDKKPFMVISYENMLVDPKRTLFSVVSQINYLRLREEFTIYPNRIYSSVISSSFNNMRHIETKKGLGKGKTDESIKFIREGSQGQWLSLPQELQNHITVHNGLTNNRVKHLL